MILTKEQINFLKIEFDIDDIGVLSEEESDELYEKLADIEVAEFIDKDESERGDIVVSIMDYIANQWEE